MARDFWLRLFGSRPSSPQPPAAAGNAGHPGGHWQHQISNRPTRTPSPLPNRVETAEKVACDAMQADRARMRWLELEVARLSALAAEPADEMQAALQEQKQDYVTRLLRFQADVQASKEAAELLRQEVSRLRGKVHQRGFEVLAQQQLLQVAQQQLAQQEAQVADAKAACAGLSVRVEALCVKAVAAANMLDGAMKQPAGTANVQLGAGISKCMEVLQGLMQLPDTMAQLTKAATAPAPAPLPTADSHKQQQQQQQRQQQQQQQQQEFSSAAELAARLQQQQQQQALWSPSPADKQQLQSTLWVTDGTPRHASCPTDNPSPCPPGAAAAAAEMCAAASRQQPKGGANAGSNSRLNSRSVSPEFWRIAQGTELMGGAGNLPRPQSHTGVTTRSDDPTLSCTRTRGSRRYSSDDGSCDRGSNGGGYGGSNGGCGGYRGSNGGYPGSNDCRAAAAHGSSYPTSHGSSGRLPQMPVPLARLKARRLSDRAAAAAAVAAATTRVGPTRAYSSSGPSSPAAAAAGMGGTYGSKFSSTGRQQGDEAESVWLTPRFPQLAVAAERAHKAFAHEEQQHCDGQQQGAGGEGAWAIPARAQPAVLAEQQARDIFRRQYQKQQQQQEQKVEPFGAGYARGYEQREYEQQQQMQQQQQQGTRQEAWGRGPGPSEMRHGVVQQPGQAQGYWRGSGEEAQQQYGNRGGPGGRACDNSSYLGQTPYAHTQGNMPQERTDMQQQHQHQEQQRHQPQQPQQNYQQPAFQQQQQQGQQQQQQRYRSLNSSERFGSGSLAQDKQQQYQQQQAQQEAREQEQSELWLQQKQHQLRQLQQMRALVEERVGNMHLHLADEQFQKHNHEQQ